MLDFERNMSETSRRLNHQVMFEDGDNEVSDLASTMASVSASDWVDNIDVNVHTSFSVPPSAEQHSSPSSDVAFCKAINFRGKSPSLVHLSEVSTSLLNLSQCSTLTSLHSLNVKKLNQYLN